MKRVYLDTSLILSPFRIQDPNYSLMKIIKKQNHLQFVTSTLSIIEIFNILLREKETFKLALNKLLTNNDLIELSFLSKNLQIRLAIEFLLDYYNIHILSDDKPEFEKFRSIQIKIHPIFKLLISFTISSRLRTLDLLHYCHAKYFTEYKDFSINYVVTADHLFQSGREVLKSDSITLLLSPETFIDLECQKNQ
ncbi:MAG: hypothetical protein HeimC3_46620 [Candidatus Heimdallarchaeota archaeon LC_3]|nr:MAG: hypothetical protein HeimC3_46620 [Candidatus Heimdallarchaeota archaeon LC_3]